MSSIHLTIADLAELVELSVTKARAAPAMVHLLSCEKCKKVLVRRYPGQGRALLQKCGIPLADMIEQTRQRLGLDDEMMRLPSLLAELREKRPADRLMLIKNSGRFRKLSVVGGILEEGRGVWHEDAHCAEEWIRLALALLAELSGQSPSESCPRPVLADYWARAWAYLANTLRIQSSLELAAEGFQRAEAWLAMGTQDPQEMALVAWCRANLARDQRRFDEAEKLAVEALASYREIQHVTDAAAVETCLVFIKLYAGQTTSAVELLESFFERYDRKAVGNRTYLAALDAYTMALTEVGEVATARASLLEARRLADGAPGSLEAARRDWLEARVEHKAGQLGSAEPLFRKTLATYLIHESPYDAALVTLDLALVLLELGEPDEVKELAEEMIPIFLSRDIHREATAAGLLLARALLGDTASATLIRHVSRYLRLARNDPSFRYQPPEQ